MLIARVVGTLVSTQKHRKFEGATLLLVQPLTEGDQPRGPVLLAVDTVGAGVHEKVLVVLDGKAAGDAMQKKAAPLYGISFLCSLLSAFVLGKIIFHLTISTSLYGMKVGLAVWAAFVMTGHRNTIWSLIAFRTKCPFIARP